MKNNRRRSNCNMFNFVIAVLTAANVCSGAILTAKQVETTNRIDELHSMVTDAENVECFAAKAEQGRVAKRKTIKITYTSLALPDVSDNSFKSYMSYKAITNTASTQYKMQQEAWTDDMGLRRYGDDYMVAMGTYYAEQCGERFRITLDTDEVFTVVTGDIKADCHTNKNHMYSSVYNYDGTFRSANILEFIVDTKKLDKYPKNLGDISGYDKFSGNITKIERIDVDED